MKSEHKEFVIKLSSELSKRNMTFDQFLADADLKRLAPMTGRFPDVKVEAPQQAGVIVTKPTPIDVVFGRGK